MYNSTIRYYNFLQLMMLIITCMYDIIKSCHILSSHAYTVYMSWSDLNFQLL